MRLELAAVVFIGILLASSYTSAAPVTYAFTGTATSTSGIFTGQGTSVTGTYTLDTSLFVDVLASPEVDRFLPIFNPPTAVWNITITLGSVTRDSADNANSPGWNHHVLGMTDSAVFDQWQLTTFRQFATDDVLTLEVSDFLPSPPDGLRIGTGNLDAGPIFEPGDLSLYSDVSGGFVEARDEFGVTEGVLNFDLESVTLVPEPSTGLLVGLGLAGLGATRRRAGA